MNKRTQRKTGMPETVNTVNDLLKIYKNCIQSATKELNVSPDVAKKVSKYTVDDIIFYG